VIAVSVGDDEVSKLKNPLKAGVDGLTSLMVIDLVPQNVPPVKSPFSFETESCGMLDRTSTSAYP